MTIITITELNFPDPQIPNVADVYYSLQGSVSSLSGHMRIEVPSDFLEKIKQDVTVILKKQIEET